MSTPPAGVAAAPAAASSVEPALPATTMPMENHAATAARTMIVPAGAEHATASHAPPMDAAAAPVDAVQPSPPVSTDSGVDQATATTTVDHAQPAPAVVEAAPSLPTDEHSSSSHPPSPSVVDVAPAVPVEQSLPTTQLAAALPVAIDALVPSDVVPLHPTALPATSSASTSTSEPSAAAAAAGADPSLEAPVSVHYYYAPLATDGTALAASDVPPDLAPELSEVAPDPLDGAPPEEPSPTPPSRSSSHRQSHSSGSLHSDGSVSPAPATPSSAASSATPIPRAAFPVAARNHHCDAPASLSSTSSASSLAPPSASAAWATEQGQLVAQLLAEFTGLPSSTSMHLLGASRRPSLPASNMGSSVPTPRTLNGTFLSVPNSSRPGDAPPPPPAPSAGESLSRRIALEKEQAQLDLAQEEVRKQKEEMEKERAEMKAREEELTAKEHELEDTFNAALSKQQKRLGPSSSAEDEMGGMNSAPPTEDGAAAPLTPRSALAAELHQARNLALSQLEDELQLERDRRMAELQQEIDSNEATLLQEQKQLNAFKADRLVALSAQITQEVSDARAEQLAQLEAEMAALRTQRIEELHAQGLAQPVTVEEREKAMEEMRAEVAAEKLQLHAMFDDAKHQMSTELTTMRDEQLAALEKEASTAREEKVQLEAQFEEAKQRMASELVSMRDAQLTRLKNEAATAHHALIVDLDHGKHAVKQAWFKEWGAAIHAWLQGAKERNLPLDILVDELAQHLRMLAAERERRTLKKMPALMKPRAKPIVGVNMGALTPSSRQHAHDASKLSTERNFSSSSSEAPSKAVTERWSDASKMSTERSEAPASISVHVTGVNGELTPAGLDAALLAAAHQVQAHHAHLNGAVVGPGAIIAASGENGLPWNGNHAPASSSSSSSSSSSAAPLTPRAPSRPPPQTPRSRADAGAGEPEQQLP